MADNKAIIRGVTAEVKRLVAEKKDREKEEAADKEESQLMVQLASAEAVVNAIESFKADLTSLPTLLAEEVGKIQIEAPKIEIPEIKMPEIKVPEAKVTVDVPEIKVPDIKVNVPAIKIPKITVPKPEVTVNIPKAETPTVNVPETKFPATMKVVSVDPKGNYVSPTTSSGGGGGVKTQKWTHRNIADNSTTILSEGPCVLHSITVNSQGTGATQSVRLSPSQGVFLPY